MAHQSACSFTFGLLLVLLSVACTATPAVAPAPMLSTPSGSASMTPPPTAFLATPTREPTQTATPKLDTSLILNDEYKNVQQPPPDPDVPTLLGHTNMQTLSPTRANAERMFSLEGGPLGTKGIRLVTMPDGDNSMRLYIENKMVPGGYMEGRYAFFFPPERAFWSTERGPSGERLFIIEYALQKKKSDGTGKNVIARFYLSENAAVWADFDNTRVSISVYEIPGKKAGPDLVRWGGGDIVGIYIPNNLDGMVDFLKKDRADGAVARINVYEYPDTALTIIPR